MTSVPNTSAITSHLPSLGQVPDSVADLRDQLSHSGADLLETISNARDKAMSATDKAIAKTDKAIAKADKAFTKTTKRAKRSAKRSKSKAVKLAHSPQLPSALTKQKAPKGKRAGIAIGGLAVVALVFGIVKQRAAAKASAAEADAAPSNLSGFDSTRAARS